MILSGQLEVGQRNGHTCRHTQQNDVHNKQNSIQREVLSAPQRRKNVIQLHWYCATINTKQTYLQHIEKKCKVYKSLAMVHYMVTEN